MRALVVVLLVPLLACGKRSAPPPPPPETCPSYANIHVDADGRTVTVAGVPPHPPHALAEAMAFQPPGAKDLVYGQLHLSAMPPYDSFTGTFDREIPRGACIYFGDFDMLGPVGRVTR